MERLTMHTPDNFGYAEYQLKPGVDEQDAVSRLAAYENTGLEPEEITKEPQPCVFYCNRKCTLNGDWCAEGPGCQLEMDKDQIAHIRNLLAAEQDGRLVELPCPFYSEVYALSQVGKEIIHGELRSTNKDYCLIVNSEGELTSKGKTWHGVQVRKQDVFLTREAAEAALKAGDTP